MVQINKLKGEIVANGFTQKDIAKHINMSPRTFSNRLKTGRFYNDEIDMIIKKLNLNMKTAIEIFFTNKVS